MRNYLLIILGILSLSAVAQEGAFDSTKELTLEEEQGAQSYVHEGKLRNTTLELCNDPENKYSDLCTQQSKAFDGGSMRTIEAMLPAVTKAYALIMSLNGGKVKTFAKSATGEQIFIDSDGKETLVEDPNGVSNKNSKAGNADSKPEAPTESSASDTSEVSEKNRKKTDEKTDICSYIPIAGEAIAVGLAQGRNEIAQSTYEQSARETKQAAAFYALAGTHKDLAKESKIQMGIWGSAAGCYAAQMAMPSVVKDWKIIAKMGGSSLIAIFYKKKIDAHKERAKLLEELAKKLPQAGECNPFSNTSCFCNEPTSFTIDPTNYNKFCVPKALALRNKETGKNDSTICVNAEGKPDAACDCKTKGTCLDRRLQAEAINLEIAPTLLNDPLEGLKPLGQGFGTGKLGPATRRNLFAAKTQLDKIKPDNSDLNKAQTALAKEFQNLGLPTGAAITLAKNSSDLDGAGGGALSSGLNPASLSNNLGKENQVAYVKKSSYVSGKNNRTKRQRPNSSSRQKRRAKKGSGVQIENYNNLVNKATRAAEISETKESIFEVINNRYQLSAWKKFPKSFNLEN